MTVRWCCNYIVWQGVPCNDGARQILIALCSNILETAVVVVVEVLGGLSLIWLKLMSMNRLVVEKCEYVEKRSCRVHRPSDDLIRETLEWLSQPCVTYLAPLLWTLFTNCIPLAWCVSHILHLFSNVGHTNPVKI